MKKSLLLFLLASFIVFPLFSANDNNEESDSENIELEIKDNKDKPDNGNHRSPSYYFIDVYLYRNNTLEVCYYGENNGELFLYHNNILFNYSSELNASFQLMTPGLYKIVIIEESWTATGYISI